MKKIGIFGGTFSPPHNGHLQAAKAFIDELSLDCLIVVPTNIPPHKSVSDNDPIARLEMTRLAFCDFPKTEVSDYEVKTEGKSYTANTLSHFYNCYSEHNNKNFSLYFMCGTDMFLTLKSWYRPDIICSLATIVLMRREDGGKQQELLNEQKLLYERFSASVVTLKHRPLELSSTEVRKFVSEKKDISSLVPKKVRDYILSHRLYEKE